MLLKELARAVVHLESPTGASRTFCCGLVMLGLPADLLLQPSAYQLPALSVKHSLPSRATSMRRLQSSALFRLTLRGGAGAALTGSYMERRSRSALAAAAVDLIDAPTSTVLPGEAPLSLSDWKYRTEQGMLKSGQDERENRWLALSNGLKVLLVHDSKVSHCCLLASRYFHAASNKQSSLWRIHACSTVCFEICTR
jgi:hypothetical protein